jgi:hypothetical protein
MFLKTGADKIAVPLLSAHKKPLKLHNKNFVNLFMKPLKTLPSLAFAITLAVPALRADQTLQGDDIASLCQSADIVA